MRRKSFIFFSSTFIISKSRCLRRIGFAQTGCLLQVISCVDLVFSIHLLAKVILGVEKWFKLLV